MPTTTFALRMLAWLKAAGVRRVFGIPGGLAHPLFVALGDDPELELVVTRHEEGAAFMADGSARASGELAACAATAGPGATNLLTGVACAHADGIPLIALTGQAARRTIGLGTSQECAREGIDLVGMFASVSAWSSMIGRPEDLDRHMAAALRAQRAGRPAPIHLNVPVDLWSQPVADGPIAPPVAPRCVDLDAVDLAAAALEQADEPLILVGSGAIGARHLLAEFAERLDADVVTTPRAKGLFPEDAPRSLGVLGFGGQAAARRAAYEESDLLLAIGATLNETTTSGFLPGLCEGRRVVQIDVDPTRIGRAYPVDVGVVGDASAVLTALLAALSSRTPRPRRASARTPDPAEPTPASAALHPARWRQELQAALPARAVIFSDIGGHMLFNLRHLRIGAGQRFVLNLGFGSMGHGTAAPIGAALAFAGSRPVIAIVGDACLGMNGMELLTAVEVGAQVVWIVEDNQMHGITWHGARALEGRGMDAVVPRHPLDVAAWSRALGLPTWVVDGPGQIADALSRALPGPGLIQVRVDPSVAPPLGERARAFEGFQR
ncbi:MAG: thiamine pyrophosphate-binding protein [Myxococcales bacterium]|nr:thiamine pyrophosphate-binding protein [Myxococcales bacterium]MCB9707051.1 thiamine pyrophosphate-binding protein [Myxococcales bacterium]